MPRRLARCQYGQPRAMQRAARNVEVLANLNGGDVLLPHQTHRLRALFHRVAPRQFQIQAAVIHLAQAVRRRLLVQRRA